LTLFTIYGEFLIRIQSKKEATGVTDIKKTYAVLTGDLVKSSRLTIAKSKSAMERLKKMAIEFAEQHPEAIVGRMDTFRHDSWQLLLEQPALALRAAVFLRAALKMESDAKIKYDTRISIGIGKVESVSRSRISNSRGPAFTHSGKGLDAMDGQCLVLVPGSETLVLWDVLECGFVPLLDCVAGDWTPKESRAVYGALKGWTQEESARNWPLDDKTGKRLTRQAVGDSLMRAHWSTVDAVLLWVEKEIKQAQELA
jgi:hypothetical protein